MRDYISRRQKVQQKKNVRSTLFFIILTISTFFILIFFGIPLVVKYVGFLTNLKKSNDQIDQEDTTPPPPPTFEYFPESTKESDIDIKGFTEPGSIVVLYINNEANELVTDNEGGFSYKLTLTGNEYVVEAIAKDKSGNESKRVVGGKIVIDKEPPELTINKPADKEQFFGSTNKQIRIEGTTEAESKVNINGRNVIVNSSGSFTHSITLNEGENAFSITSEDQAGNKNEKIITVSFSF